MAIDLTNGYKYLKAHLGHEIVCVSYADGDNIAIECKTCSCMLVNSNKLEDDFPSEYELNEREWQRHYGQKNDEGYSEASMRAQGRMMT